MHAGMAIAHGVGIDPVLAAPVPPRPPRPRPDAGDVFMAHSRPIPRKLRSPIGLNPDGGALIARAEQPLIRAGGFHLAKDEQPATRDPGEQAALAFGNG